MLAVRARHYKLLSLPKAGYQVGLTSLLLLAGAGSVHDATALNETRTLAFHHTHSNEDLTITFKRDGRYDDDALKKLNHFLRDWRTQDETTMDRRLFDILWEVYRDVDAKQPINIISSYRSPATNAMLRRRSSGVARFSQHMLGHAMDFYIPGVPLEQIRYAGLRLQRGGVGFYPTSGSPFVHLDTGSIRHWPRMTHDQLAKVFPDGRTVHVPSDGNPLKGYELARADIERRGNGDGSSSGGGNIGGFLTALFKGRSAAGSDEDDEGAATPAAAEKSAPAVVLASAKSADPVPMPRAKPQFASTIQFAAADAQIIPSAKAKPAAPAPAEKSEPKPETPADIINARGFWGDDLPAPKQATAAQIAALKAREAVGAADPQATASVSENFNKALAYAPANSPVDHSNIVAASAPVPRSVRPTRNAGAAATEINTVVAKGAQGQGSVIATSTRISAAKGNDLWMRVVMLAPSASNAMLTTVLGDTDMTLMRAHFVKPQAAITMTFSNDPMMGMNCDTFTGSATATLPTTSFVVRTAALR
ncbi:DUF882 domain-containing protein [Bradyrhizobium cenepequi]